ncbi:MAG: hypothetical protein P4L77_13190 [Sulfuriferula sp.]|nr:hypothetical protein [Sulfuriferula sp.]
MKFYLANSLQAWGTPEFNRVLKHEIEQLNADQLPLQQGLSVGSYALDGKLQTVIFDASQLNDCIRVKIGIFYTSIIAGCSCANDPTPIDENTEHCVAQLDIHADTAEGTLILLEE